MKIDKFTVDGVDISKYVFKGEVLEEEFLGDFASEKIYDVMFPPPAARFAPVEMIFSDWNLDFGFRRMVKICAPVSHEDGVVSYPLEIIP